MDQQSQVIDGLEAGCLCSTLRETITRRKLRAIDGYLPIPQEPGLGIDLDEEQVARYRVV
jgi:L-alanine-DL-glutamate epimerase-like enolase superfamily enzyme